MSAHGPNVFVVRTARIDLRSLFLGLCRTENGLSADVDLVEDFASRVLAGFLLGAATSYEDDGFSECSIFQDDSAHMLL